MRLYEFKKWLELQGLSENSIRTYLSDAKRVESHYGDLDDRYDRDELLTVLAELEYTKTDEQRNRENPSKILIKAQSPYNSLQSHKAALVKYVEYRKAEMHRWDEYLNAAAQLIEDGTLDQEEGYKDALARDVAAVRTQLLAHEEDWAALLIAAVSGSKNDLIDWRYKTKIVEWIEQDTAAVGDALAEMWADDSEQTLIERVRSFDAKLPEHVFTRVSPTARLDLSSYLMMAMPEEGLPPVKLTAFERTYDQLGYPPSDDADDDVAGRYGHALAFLDRLIAEAGKRGILTSPERRELEACVRSHREDHGVGRRANAIFLLDDGKSW